MKYLNVCYWIDSNHSRHSNGQVIKNDDDEKSINYDPEDDTTLVDSQLKIWIKNESQHISFWCFTFS